MRINKYLAHQKYCTRRAADDLIKKRKVSINGRVAVLGDKVSEGDKVEVNFRPKKYKYYAYNKPRGVITTRRDPDGRRTVFDLLGDAAHGLVAVGRLDRASTGLLILTNDTALADALTNPANRVPRRYVVTVRGRVTPETLSAHGWPATFEPACFVCGPTGFVEAVADMLVDLGHAPGLIRTERFGPTG